MVATEDTAALEKTRGLSKSCLSDGVLAWDVGGLGSILGPWNVYCKRKYTKRAKPQTYDTYIRVKVKQIATVLKEAKRLNSLDK